MNNVIVANYYFLFLLCFYSLRESLDITTPPKFSLTIICISFSYVNDHDNISTVSSNDELHALKRHRNQVAYHLTHHPINSPLTTCNAPTYNLHINDLRLSTYNLRLSTHDSQLTTYDFQLTTLTSRLPPPPYIDISEISAIGISTPLTTIIVPSCLKRTAEIIP